MKRLLLFFLFSNITLAAHENTDTIPVVHYTPFNFEKNIDSAFRGVSSLSDKDVSDTNREIAKFNLVNCKTDSVFFLALLPYESSDYQFIGVIHDGSICYYDRQNQLYSSIEELTIVKFGSVEKFIEVYIGSYRHKLLKSRNNSLYNMSQESAIKFIRDSYLFSWYCHHNKYSAVDAFCKLFQELMPDTKLDATVIMSEMTNIPIEGNGEDLFNLTRANDYIPLCNRNIYPLLEKLLSKDVVRIFYERYSIYQTKLRSALDVVRKNNYKDICKYYYSCENGIVSDSMIVEYLCTIESE